jgi:hypothetical protein
MLSEKHSIMASWYRTSWKTFSFSLYSILKLSFTTTTSVLYQTDTKKFKKQKQKKSSICLWEAFELKPNCKNISKTKINHILCFFLNRNISYFNEPLTFAISSPYGGGDYLQCGGLYYPYQHIRMTFNVELQLLAPLSLMQSKEKHASLQ